MAAEAEPLPFDGLCVFASQTMMASVQKAIGKKDQGMPVARWTSASSLTTEHVMESVATFRFERQFSIILCVDVNVSESARDLAAQNSFVVMESPDCSPTFLKSVRLEIQKIKKSNPEWVHWRPFGTGEVTMFHRPTPTQLARLASEDGCTHVVSLLRGSEHPEEVGECCRSLGIVWTHVDMDGGNVIKLQKDAKRVLAAARRTLQLLMGSPSQSEDGGGEDEEAVTTPPSRASSSTTTTVPEPSPASSLEDKERERSTFEGKEDPDEEEEEEQSARERRGGGGGGGGKNDEKAERSESGTLSPRSHASGTARSSDARVEASATKGVEGGVDIDAPCDVVTRSRPVRLLIHCAAGIHRTGTFMYLLLRLSGLNPSEAALELSYIRPVTGRQVGGHRLDLVEALLGKVSAK